jgi:hypothetical protein
MSPWNKIAKKHLKAIVTRSQNPLIATPDQKNTTRIIHPPEFAENQADS